MLLHVDSDAAYLVNSMAKSHLAELFQFVHQHPSPGNFVNGPILVECKTLKQVVASSSKSETAAVFHYLQIVLPIHYMLTYMGFPKTPTLFCLDNKAMENFIKITSLQRNALNH